MFFRHIIKKRCNHNDFCPLSFFNRRAVGWFRKIVALSVALNYNYKSIVFLDADIIFNKQGLNIVINDIFSKKVGTFYMLGPHRRAIDKGIESGIIGFQKDYGGYELLDKVISVYKNGDFRKYRRWDDGYVFKKVIEEHSTNSLDVITSNVSRVADTSPFAKYLVHNKGVYNRTVLNEKKYTLVSRT